MRLGSSHLALGGLVALLWASACGGTTGRNQRHDEPSAGEQQRPGEAGRAGEACGVTSLGGAGHAGGALGAAAGEPAEVAGVGNDEGGSGGAGGRGGDTTAAGADEGGAGGASLDCCAPLDCRDILGELECGTNRYSDGCGGSFRCDCAQGFVCEQNSCVLCDPGPDPCGGDGALCGETRDRCGAAIVCPDDCSTLEAGSTCHQGRCCTPSKTSCAADDCGHILIGCGQSLDCTGTVCPGDTTCQSSGKCCKPTVECLPTNCGLKADGCGNYLECSFECPEGTVCLDNECVPSECQLAALECGQAYNAAVDGLEYCGACAGGLACRDNFCLPWCE